MKYYTAQLWSKINSDSAEEREQADLEWIENDKAYCKVFESIKDRLSKKFLKIYFDAHGFHDCDFVSFEVLQPQRWANEPITVRIIISDGECKWGLTYKNVKRVTMDYDLTAEKHMYKWGLHTWGYDEFLPIDDNQLSHEILFASGATILIQFGNKKLFIDREFLGEKEGNV